MDSDLPDVTGDLAIDAGDVAGVTIEGSALRAASGIELEISGAEAH